MPFSLSVIFWNYWNQMVCMLLLDQAHIFAQNGILAVFQGITLFYVEWFLPGLS